MPKNKQKKHTAIKHRLKLHFSKMGINLHHPLLSELLNFSIQFKNYSDASRIDKRGLKWALFAYLKQEKEEGSSVDELMTDNLASEIRTLKPKSGSTAGLLARLSRRQETAHFLVKATPKTATRFQSRLKHKSSIGQSTYTMDTLTPRRPEQPSSFLPSIKTPFRTEEDGLYKKELSAPSFELYRLMEPVQAPAPVPMMISDITLEHMKKTHPKLFEPKPDTFSFTITKKGILSREGVPRPVSQGRVVGLSAAEIFKKFGLISIDTPWGTHYHHAHRQGWMLEGSQSLANLDPATAGSNYQTLFFIESPAKRLVLEEGVDIKVEGTVYYHETLPIPVKISYKLSWGNGRKIHKSIYPLEPEGPKQGSNALSEAAFFAIKTPRRKVHDDTRETDELGDGETPPPKLK